MDSKLSGILIVTAHPSEAEAAEKAMAFTGCGCEMLVTGVGGMAMSWALQKRFSAGEAPSLVINPGIAGSYVSSLSPGDVVIPVSDCFADMGVDDNGTFVSLFRANLADPEAWPFRGGRIHCENKWLNNLPGKYRRVTAATVNMASGSEPVIERIRSAWDPEIETMEGAWFAYTCAMHRADYISVRAVSNAVEPRTIKKWNIPLALEKLEPALAEILDILKTS